MLTAPSERTVIDALPPGLPVIRRHCGATGCERRARLRGRLCERCQKRVWRATHRQRAAALERTRSFSENAKLLRKARAIIGMALKRGKLSAEPCRVCGAKGLVHHSDPSKPLEIQWLCRSHRLIQRELESEARRTEDERRAADARKAEWSALSTRFAVAWPLLPSSHQQQIQDLARQNPLIRRLHPDAPLVRQALIRAYGMWCDSG